MEDTKNINSGADEIEKGTSQNIPEGIAHNIDDSQTTPIQPEALVPSEPVVKEEITQAEPITPEKLENEIQDLISNIIALMGIKGMVRTKLLEDSFYSNLRTRGADGLLIGKRGLTILSIQAVVNQIMRHRYPNQPIDVFVDVSGYRKRHENFLKKKALAVAKVVVETKRDMALDILTEREYHMVERELIPLGTVRIYQVGSGPRRTVVIAPL
jgi:spoIIIJ-associated protein